MSDCLNPDCVTDYPVLSWLDPDYCCDACRRVHGPRSVADPDPLCARRLCGEPADPRLALYGGYCSSRCETLDMPAPVEAWAAAMGRAIDDEPMGAVEPDAPVPPPVRAVEPLTPVPAGAETYQAADDPQGPPWVDIWPTTLEVVDERHDYTVEELTALPDARTPDGFVEFVCTPAPRRSWLARLLRRTA